MMTVAAPLKIAIVDDHNLFRKGLIKLINLGDTQRRYKILFEAENGNDLMNKLKTPHLPDIVLMDIDMPDMNGFEAADWLQRTHPAVKILVISMVQSEVEILRMLKLGVKGYLSKDIEVEDMHSALDTIANNGLYYSHVANEALNAGLNGTIKSTTASINLSPNEMVFLQLATTELTYAQIAEKMNLSPKTIDGYREALFERFKVRTRVALAMFAVRHGLVEL